jgi:hypothetical protein
VSIHTFTYRGATPSDTKGTLTLEAHEAAAQRRALTRIRANVIAAVQDAMTFQSAAADTLWAALRTLDAECVAAGLATCFDASGLAVAR